MAGERILVVDDDTNLATMCTAVLERGGFQAEGVHSGTEAIELCQKEDFDVLLIDLKMPGLGGLEVLRAIKKSSFEGAAVIMTGYGTSESALEAMRLGAQDYLEKPFDGIRLVSTVRKVLAKKHQASAVMKGNLRQMSLSNIISINCSEHNQARLRIRLNNKEAVLFFEGGQIVHMTLDAQEGEEVINELLTWEEGAFELEQNVPTSKHTVTTNWSRLLLEGLHRIDEDRAGQEELGGIEVSREDNMSKAKTRTTTDILKDFLDIRGISAAVVVGRDGFMIESAGGSETVGLDPLGASLANAINGIEMMGQELEINAFRDLFVEYEGALIICRPMGDAIIALVAPDASQLGTIRYRIKPLIEELVSFF